MNSYLLLLAFQTATQIFELPPHFLEAICYTESKGVVDPPRVDDGGSHSLGICQVKLATAKSLGFRGSENDLVVPEVNIYQAGKIFAYHLSKCASPDDAVMAYNTGSCSKHNRSYLRKVMSNVR